MVTRLSPGCQARTGIYVGRWPDLNRGQQTVLVARRGGFTGGHVAAILSKRDVRVRPVVSKPPVVWQQTSSGAEAHQLNGLEREFARIRRHSRYVPQESKPLEGAV
jgi:hypothetical protein